ncbi:hypothetical protein DKT69_20500 [Micromonospora sicca]|uniref:Helix-turn-helix domain-containing protein n=1 Tax=Micromonospora sicca TaxID=2202420 RepID=A0A317DGJ0_9ACTN|nr:hypothetical protein DKT69_20500 [Micromonospora sp. 4G51]
MSQAVKAALLASKDLRPNERLVLVAIAAHTNREGQAWPSVQTIADYSGVSPPHRSPRAVPAGRRWPPGRQQGCRYRLQRLPAGCGRCDAHGPGVCHSGGWLCQPGPRVCHRQGQRGGQSY